MFGQRLDIDRGQLIFDGPADNPALDVVALRKNIAVEAGVEVTGTVRVPRVRLVSNPPVPDGEKLSWLMTGQGLDRASRADLAALGAASASLLGKGQKPITHEHRQLDRPRRHLGARAQQRRHVRAPRARSSRSASASPTA